MSPIQKSKIVDWVVTFLKISVTLFLHGLQHISGMEERRLRVFENRVLRRVFGPKRDEVTGNGENYIMRSLGIFTPYPILCGW